MVKLGGMGNDAAEMEETDILIRTRSRSVKNVAVLGLQSTQPKDRRFSRVLSEKICLLPQLGYWHKLISHIN